MPCLTLWGFFCILFPWSILPIFKKILFSFTLSLVSLFLFNLLICLRYASYYNFFPLNATNSYTAIGICQHTLLYNNILLLFIKILPSLATAFHYLFKINNSHSSNLPLVSSSPPVSCCVIWHQPSKAFILFNIFVIFWTKHVLNCFSRSEHPEETKFSSYQLHGYYFFSLEAPALNHSLEKLLSHTIHWTNFKGKTVENKIPEQNHKTVLAPSSHSTQRFNSSGFFGLRLTCNAYCMHHQPE